MLLAAGIAFATLVTPPLLRAATLDVPAVYPTIGSAMLAAAAGDTVLVQSGVYFERVALGSGVVLRGASPADPPVLDAQHAGVAVTAAACNASTKIEDFVIAAGTGAGFGGGLSLASSPITVQRCRFTGNASLQGGAVGGDDSAFTMLDCTFESNTASESGGAIAMTDLPSPWISSCRFSGNSATTGGAIAIRNGCQPSISSCVFDENTATQGGALWYDFFSGGSVTSCTIAFTASTGGIGGALFFSAFSNPSVTASIIAFSSAGSAIFAAGGSSAAFGCDDVFGNAGGNSIAGVVDLGTNFSADPLFCDAANGNFELRVDSPCAAVPSCGTVGAFGVGSCGVVGVDFVLESTSWGALKALYR